jgi:hypothetical protein
MGGRQREVMWDTLTNELKEFWPDIRGKIEAALPNRMRGASS